MKTLKISVFLSALLFIVVACDKMEAPYVNIPQVVDTAACPVPEFPELTTHTKTILLEDYTGHTCPNCPTAGKIARDLKEQYPGQLVVMAVHAGWFARTYPEAGVPQIFDYDFRTPAGTEWDAFFGNGNAGNPNGLVNRLTVNGKYVLRPNEWAGVISTKLAEAPKADLQLIVDYDPTDRKICVHTKSWFLSAIEADLKLEVVVIEDSIIATQKNNDAAIGPVGDIEDFVHMHVLRAALNGTWGTTIAFGGHDNPATVVTTTQSTLPETCVQQNCHIVAFIFNSTTREVLQAAEVKLQ